MGRSNDFAVLVSIISIIISIITAGIIIGLLIALWKCISVSFLQVPRNRLRRRNGNQMSENENGIQNEMNVAENSQDEGDGSAENAEENQQEFKILAPIFVYGSDDVTISGFNSCAICLDDFVNGELCREFPCCRHVFHSFCIDPWIKKHQTCPICRCSVVDV